MTYYSDKAQPRISNVRPIDARNARATTLNRTIIDDYHPMDTCPKKRFNFIRNEDDCSYLECLEKDP